MYTFLYCNDFSMLPFSFKVLVEHISSHTTYFEAYGYTLTRNYTMNFVEAEEYCCGMNGSLASVLTADEEQHIMGKWLQLVIPEVLYSGGSSFRSFVIPKVCYSEGSLFRRVVNPKTK